MSKKLVAVTGIKYGEGFVTQGETLDASKFSKEELKSLYDNGAITMVDDVVPTEHKLEDVTGGPAKEETAEKEAAPATPAKAATPAPAKEAPKK